MKKADLSGPWGENAAAAYLRRKRYQILERNFRCRMGEIDIICRDGEFLVFVEVKLRKTDAFGEAREFVGYHKQECLRTAAAIWLQKNPTQLQPRFDVVEIYAPEGTKTRRPVITHLEDAFQ